MPTGQLLGQLAVHALARGLQRAVCRLAQQQGMHGRTRQFLQRLPLRLAQAVARLRVQHAQRADNVALGRGQRRGSVEGQSRCPRRLAAAGEARVGGNVRDLDKAAAFQHHGAERSLARDGGQPGQADLRLDPLLVAVDQRQHRHGRRAGGASASCQAVEERIGRSVQDAQPLQRGHASRLIGRAGDIAGRTIHAPTLPCYGDFDTGSYRSSVDAPNRLWMNSTASSAVRLRTSSAGLISTTSSDRSRPVSAIISMHSCISR